MKKNKQTEIVKNKEGRETLAIPFDPDVSNMEAFCTFKVGSRKNLYMQFTELFPDIAKYCWGYEPFNWDNERRSILIRITEEEKRPGTHILYEVSRSPLDNKWSQLRVLLIPYVDLQTDVLLGGEE